MKAHIAICLTLILAVACQNAPDGTPKFKAGDLVELKLSGDNGQILSVDCKSKDPCVYLVRSEGSMKETELREFEIESPRPIPGNLNANMK